MSARSASPTTPIRRLLKSCATPPARSPRLSIFPRLLKAFFGSSPVADIQPCRENRLFRADLQQDSRQQSDKWLARPPQERNLLPRNEPLLRYSLRAVIPRLGSRPDMQIARVSPYSLLAAITGHGLPSLIKVVDEQAIIEARNSQGGRVCGECLGEFLFRKA